MASERNWLYVSQNFTANGTANGLITVANVAGFYVKAKVRVVSNTQPSLLLEVKRVNGTTQLEVGPVSSNIQDRADVSAYLVADGASITLYEQVIPKISHDDLSNYVYAREPIVAWRSVLVDEYGRFWGPTNPLPVQLQSGPIEIGTVNAELEVQLTHLDNTPDPGDVHDSVRIGDGANTMTGSAVSPGRYALDVVPANALIKKRYDSIVITARNADGDPTQIEYRLGTTVMQTVNITYNLDGDIDSVVVV